MSSNVSFIVARGEMAERVRDHAWKGTWLGPVNAWDAAVRVAVNNVLSSPFPACACFGEQLVMVYNDAFIPILGDKHPALGCAFNEVWKEAWHIIGPIARDALDGRATFIQNFPLRLKRGPGLPEQAFFTFSYSPLHGPDGAVIGMLDSVFETTASVESESRLEERASALSSKAEESDAARERMWRLSLDAMLVLDRNTCIQAANPAFCTLLGWTSADVVGKPFAELAIAADVGLLNAEVVRSDASHTFFDLEAQMVRKDGKLTSIHWTGARQEGMTLLFGRDLTAQHDSAETLRQTEHALQQSQKLESIGQLTGGIAHDFNNLLQVISGNLQLLASEFQGGERARARLEGAMAGVHRGARLTSHLLAFSRKQTLDPKVIDVGLVVTSMDDMLTRTLGQACEIEFKIERGTWNALVDAAQLENALLNLCINARDAMDEVGRLTIEVSNVELDRAYAQRNVEVAPGEYVLVAVSDTGTGMSPDVLEKVFEPFFTTKPEGKGTGLGLSMVFGFVKQSGGHIKIDSEVGHGTTVEIYLPRSLEMLAEAVDELEPAMLEGGSETILVVEDDLDVQDTVVAMLRQLGYSVLKANDAVGGLAIVESGIPVDLLFSDVIMPGPLRSPELAKRARKAQPNITVLFTSGYTESSVVHGGRLDAGVELLGKPYSHEALAKKIRRVLSNKSVERTESNEPADRIAVPLTLGRVHDVLFVDDDPTIREVAIELLHSFGHRVVVAADAEEALERLTSEHSVLVTDVTLPSLSGQELAKAVRERRPNIGVVFATGGDFPSSIKGAICLRKPYEPSELFRALDTAFQAAGC